MSTQNIQTVRIQIPKYHQLINISYVTRDCQGVMCTFMQRLFDDVSTTPQNPKDTLLVVQSESTISTPPPLIDTLDDHFLKIT